MYKIWNKLFGFDYVLIYISQKFIVARIKHKRNRNKTDVVNAYYRQQGHRHSFPVYSTTRISEWLTCEASKYFPNELPKIPYGGK